MNLHFRLGSDIFGSKGISLALIKEEWMPRHRIMDAVMRQYALSSLIVP